RTFRAAHSLKGAAAMVGLPAIAEFTHGIEAVFYRLRAASVIVAWQESTRVLFPPDHLAAMVESDAANAPIPAPAELNVRLANLQIGRASCRERVEISEVAAVVQKTLAE